MVAVLVGSACGSATRQATQEQAPSSSATTVASPVVTGPETINDAGPLPPVPTVDLHTGDIVRLDWIFPSTKPVLVWFWAPH